MSNKKTRGKSDGLTFLLHIFCNKEFLLPIRLLSFLLSLKNYSRGGVPSLSLFYSYPDLKPLTKYKQPGVLPSFPLCHVEVLFVCLSTRL